MQDFLRGTDARFVGSIQGLISSTRMGMFAGKKDAPSHRHAQQHAIGIASCPRRGGRVGASNIGIQVPLRNMRHENILHGQGFLDHVLNDLEGLDFPILYIIKGMVGFRKVKLRNSVGTSALAQVAGTAKPVAQWITLVLAEFEGVLYSKAPAGLASV